MGPGDTIRYGVIGCGVIGPVHADTVCRCGGAELVGVCDVEPDRARACAGSYGGRPYADYVEMLAAERPDAVSVCTPHHNHAEISIACLEAGCHVLCEKPLAISAEQMRSMVETGVRTRRVLGGIFQHRFDPVARAIKRAVDEGLFGQVLNAGASLRCHRDPGYYGSGRWRGTWSGEGGSVLINQALHSIDLMQWMAGPVRRVQGRFGNLRLGGHIETEDTASATLEFRDGGLGTVEATASSHLDFAAEVHVYGTCGSVRLRTGGTAAIDFLQMANGEKTRRVESLLAEAASATAPYPPPKHYYGDSHIRQISDFVASLRNGHPPFITGQDACHAVEIVLAAYESSRTGAPVAL
jgi:UDP-N-acetyl-2-amino-2-deoxyglucuronate dehydrogenase